jgi:transmembrane sensor
MPEKYVDLLIKVLTNNANAEEKRLFNAWLDESEQNRLYYQQSSVIWERIASVHDKTVFNETAAKEKIRLKIQQMKPGARIITKRSVISVAASIVLLIGFATALLYFSKPGGHNYLAYTSSDKIREIVLPDSSHVWLNLNSTLYASKTFSSSQRKVILEGEAYFEVKHDESKPFKVKAGNTIIKVLGTSFDVKTEKENNNVSVVVNSGKVAFYKTNSLHDNYILTQGTKGQFIASDLKIIVSGNKNQNYLSWKTGILSFYDTPLSEVCSILGDHYDKKIIANSIDSELVLTGSFKNEELAEIVKTIELTLDVELTVFENADPTPH